MISGLVTLRLKISLPFIGTSNVVGLFGWPIMDIIRCSSIMKFQKKVGDISPKDDRKTFARRVSRSKIKSDIYDAQLGRMRRKKLEDDTKLRLEVLTAPPSVPETLKQIVINGTREQVELLSEAFKKKVRSRSPRFIKIIEWNKLIESCKQLKDPILAETIFNDMMEAKVRPNLGTWAALVSVYLRCNRLNGAELVLVKMQHDFKTIPPPSLILKILEACPKHRDLATANRMFTALLTIASSSLYSTRITSSIAGSVQIKKLGLDMSSSSTSLLPSSAYLSLAYCQALAGCVDECNSTYAQFKADGGGTMMAGLGMDEIQAACFISSGDVSAAVKCSLRMMRAASGLLVSSRLTGLALSDVGKLIMTSSSSLEQACSYFDSLIDSSHLPSTSYLNDLINLLLTSSSSLEEGLKKSFDVIKRFCLLSYKLDNDRFEILSLNTRIVAGHDNDSGRGVPVMPAAPVMKELDVIFPLTWNALISTGSKLFNNDNKKDEDDLTTIIASRGIIQALTTSPDYKLKPPSASVYNQSMIQPALNGELQTVSNVISQMRRVKIMPDDETKQMYLLAECNNEVEGPLLLLSAARLANTIMARKICDMTEKTWKGIFCSNSLLGANFFNNDPVEDVKIVKTAEFIVCLLEEFKKKQFWPGQGLEAVLTSIVKVQEREKGLMVAGVKELVVSNDLVRSKSMALIQLAGKTKLFGLRRQSAQKQLDGKDSKNRKRSKSY